MTTYEWLDGIADNVNPVLGLATLGWAWVVRKRVPMGALVANMATLLAVALAYAVKALDQNFDWWESIGLNYSTHAGVHTAIVVSLWWIDKRAGAVGTAIALCYGLLMLYQKYHSVGDLLSTSAVIAATSCAAWLLTRLLMRRIRGDRRTTVAS